MKNSVKLFLLAALALLSIACTHKTLESVSGSAALQIKGGVATKADGGYWTYDKIGVRAASPVTSTAYADYQNVGYSTSETGVATTDFSAINEAIYLDEEDGDISFTAYGPYTASDDIATLPGEEGVISKSTLDQTDATALDFLYAGEQTASYANPTLSLNFYHKMAQVVVNITAGYGVSSDDVAGAAYTISGLIHSGSFNVTTGAAQTDATASAEDLTLAGNCPSTTDDINGITYSFIVYPQTISSISLGGTVTDYGSFSKDLSDINNLTAYEEGNSYVYNLELAVEHNLLVLNATGCTINGWNSEYVWDGSATLGGDDSDSQGDDGNGENNTPASLTGTNYYVILLDDTSYETISDNVDLDLRTGTGSGTTADPYSGGELWVWSDTYYSGTCTGTNFYGNEGEWWSLVVNSVGWSGLGYDLYLNTDQAEVEHKLNNTDFYLHFAYKSSQSGTGHELYLCGPDGTEGTHIYFGEQALGDTHTLYSPVSGSYVSGEWNEYEIPLSVFNLDWSSTYGTEENILCVSSGSTQGTTLDMDAIFIYKK